MNKKNIAIFIILIVAIIGGYYVYSNYISAKGRAWNALQDYLNAARSHDLERLATLSHQLSEACKEPVATDDCNTRMDTVYNFGSPFKRENFVHTWSDPHQIILASDWVLEETEELSARTRSIIYFTVQDGQIKLLSFKPAQGTFIVKDKERPMPEAELLPKLIEYTEDADMDGVEDYLEQCLSRTSQNDSCIETDPAIRDTDGNGYWDGVQALFYK